MMDFITPQHTMIFAVFLISLSLVYKWVECRLLKCMLEQPEAFRHIGKEFRYRYQQLYREQSDARHIHLFDDEVTKKRLGAIKPSQLQSLDEKRE
ncbi:hypothetical protein J2Z32_002963 [Paenibacillus turicensis]|uniref:Uncharacterized protein n=2 Tax=Paenibacillus turicensis TaxID=160487 RepID=A0ABS4FV30_9BACL|nr:hypothetical protein [Paenibacillus turicensis]